MEASKYDGDKTRRRWRRKPTGVFLYWCCLIGVMVPLIVAGFAVPLYYNLSTRSDNGPMLNVTQTQELMLGGDDMLNAGDVIHIVTVVKNSGSGHIANVTIGDDKPIGTICTPGGVDNVIGTLQVGEMATCFGIHIVTQMDIDLMTFSVNSTVTGHDEQAIPLSSEVGSISNLTQTTFGALSVTQMAMVNKGPDDFLSEGETVDVTVKLQNIGTETLLNLTSTSFNGTITHELLPLEIINFTYIIILTQEMIDDDVLVLNETGIGIGTTSAMIVDDTSILLVNVTQPVEGRLRTTTTFMKTTTCAQVGDIMMIDVLVENYGTGPVNNVAVANTLIGTSLICTPMGIDNTIGTLLPGQQETCSGGYMLTSMDVTFGIDSLFISNTSAVGMNVPTVMDSNLEFTYDAVYILYFQKITSPVPASNGFSTVDYTISPGYIIGTNTPFAAAGCRTSVEQQSVKNMAGRSITYSNIMLTPRHISAGYWIENVNSGSIQVYTDPPNMFSTWDITIVGAGTWNPATGIGTRTGINVFWYFTVYNLPSINSIRVQFNGIDPIDTVTARIIETVNTTYYFP